MADDSQEPFANVAAFFRDLADGKIKNTINQATRHLAQLINNQVKGQYYSLAKPPTGVELSVMQRGKESGPLSGRPAKYPIGSSSIMSVLGSNVVTLAEGKAAYRIQIDPAVLLNQAKKTKIADYSAGVPLGLIAWWIENRRGATVPVTWLMEVYQRILREGRGGYETRKMDRPIKTNPLRGGTIAMFPPDLPVWRYVLDRLEKTAQVVAKDIAQQLQAVGKAHGGVPT